MMFFLVISSAARNDIFEATTWYEDKREGLSIDFELCTEAGLYQILSNPLLFQERYKNVRINFIERFPCASTFNQNIGSWNTINVTSMEAMFRYSIGFNQDIGLWNTLNVRNMVSMFKGATAFNQNLSKWKLNSVGSIFDIFDYSGLKCNNYSKTLIGWANQINVPSNLNMGEATGMKYYGEGATARATLIAKGWYINGDIQVISQESTKSGNWKDASLWSCGEVPVIDFGLKIKSGHLVELPAGETGFFKNLVLEGNLILGENTIIHTKPN